MLEFYGEELDPEESKEAVRRKEIKQQLDSLNAALASGRPCNRFVPSEKLINEVIRQSYAMYARNLAIIEGYQAEEQFKEAEKILQEIREIEIEI